jgi:Protein of unknown function (DUF3489)
MNSVALKTREEIAATAERIRQCGIPDFLNRWLNLTPEELDTIENRVEASQRKRYPEEPMKPIGPKEQALRESRKATTRAMVAAVNDSKTATEPPPQEATKETTMKKKTTKKATQAKARTPVKGKTEVRPGSKLEIIVGLLKRPEGCTMAEVSEKVGWKTMSFPQQAKAANLKLRTEKQGKTTRYWAA